jgi:hypothetical protein
MLPEIVLLPERFSIREKVMLSVGPFVAPFSENALASVIPFDNCTRPALNETVPLERAFPCRTSSRPPTALMLPPKALDAVKTSVPDPVFVRPPDWLLVRPVPNVTV